MSSIVSRFSRSRPVPTAVNDGADWKDARNAVERHEPDLEQLVQNCEAADARVWHLVTQLRDALEGVGDCQDRLCNELKRRGTRLDITPNPILPSEIIARLREEHPHA